MSERVGSKGQNEEALSSLHAAIATKIKASGAQALITGNWGDDLTLLTKAAKDVGYEGKFYTFDGNALGALAAIGEAGIRKVVAVADWLPNAPRAASSTWKAMAIALRW